TNFDGGARHCIDGYASFGGDGLIGLQVIGGALANGKRIISGRTGSGDMEIYVFDSSLYNCTDGSNGAIVAYANSDGGVHIYDPRLEAQSFDYACYFDA